MGTTVGTVLTWFRLCKIYASDRPLGVGFQRAHEEEQKSVETPRATGYITIE